MNRCTRLSRTKTRFPIPIYSRPTPISRFFSASFRRSQAHEAPELIPNRGRLSKILATYELFKLKYEYVIIITVVNTLGVLVLCNMKEDPISGQKRFKYPWTSEEAWLKEQEQLHNSAGDGEFRMFGVDAGLLDAPRGPPEVKCVKWPEYHPSTLACRKVLDRLLVGNGLNPDEWEMVIDHLPGES